MAEDARRVLPIVVKKYANRRLYDTESSLYITLETLADMVRQGRDFVVYDAKTGDDITRAVLTQIIMEEEIRGRNMLPTSFLRQLISFYGHSMQGLVPDYLERMMEQFARHQHEVRASIQRSIKNFLPTECGLAESGEIASAEFASAEFASADWPKSASAPLRRPDEEAGRAEAAPETRSEARHDLVELAELREEVALLRRQLADLAANLNDADTSVGKALLPLAAVEGVRH